MTRWGFYGKSAVWYKCKTRRIELIIQYALSQEPRRVMDGLDDLNEADIGPLQKIDRIKNAGAHTHTHTHMHHAYAHATCTCTCTCTCT